MSNTTLSPTADIQPPLAYEWWEVLDAQAKSTPCAYENCDGLMHEFNVDPESWNHRVAQYEFANFAGEIYAFPKSDPVYRASVFIDFDLEMSAEEVRELADNYELLPEWLRSIANRVDELNGIQSGPDGVPAHIRAMVTPHPFDPMAAAIADSMTGAK